MFEGISDGTQTLGEIFSLYCVPSWTISFFFFKPGMYKCLCSKTKVCKNMLFSFAALSLCLLSFLCFKSLLSFQSFIYHFPWRFRSEVASVWPSIPLLNSWLPCFIYFTWVQDLIMFCPIFLPCVMGESIVARDDLTHLTFSRGYQESVMVNVSVIFLLRS